MGQRCLLGFLQVLQQSAGGGNGELHAGDAEACQVPGAELGGQQAFGDLAIKVPRRARYAPPTPPFQRVSNAFVRAGQCGIAFRDQQFHGLQTRQFGGQCFYAVGLADRETTAGEVYAGEASEWRAGLAACASCIAGHPQRHDQGIAVRFQQGVVGDRAWRDDAHHRAFHWAFRFGRVADLFADGHALALADETPEVRLEGDYRDARHGNG